MRVSFPDMLQRNTTTGWQRDVRCVSAARGYVFSDMWQWQDPTKGSWECFEVATGRLLEACSILAHSPVSIMVGGIPYEADVTAMQLKRDTAAPSPAPPPILIRRLTPDDLPKWEWQNEHGVWVAYPSALVHCFEAARDAGDSSSPFHIGGRGYQLHLDRMEQENLRSGVVRKVQRSAPRGSTQPVPGAGEQEGRVPTARMHPLPPGPAGTVVHCSVGHVLRTAHRAALSWGVSVSVCEPDHWHASAKHVHTHCLL